MRRLAIIISCVFFCHSLHGADSDTLRTARPIDEIVVTGTRMRTDVRRLPVTVSVVGRDKIENSLNPSLLPILSEQVPGLFVTSRGIMGYGVSGGAAGSISLRGLSGGTGRMMVLIDGHPQYMGIMGHPIADAYQSLLADRVEVLRGPASVLYGSNAMGGVINIVTRGMHESGVRTGVNVGYGSFGTLQTEATNRIRTGRFSSVVSASYNRTDGHRRDMGFEQGGGYAKLGYEISRRWSVRADVNVTHFNASNPGSVTAPLTDARQRITRGMTSVAVDNDYDKTAGTVSFFYNWGRHRINDGYGQGASPKLFRCNSRDNMMGVSVYQSVRPFASGRFTFGADWYRFGGRAWNHFVQGEQSGQDVQIVDRTEHEIAGYADYNQNIARWLTLNAGIRFDYHSRVGSQWVPQAGLSFSLPHDMSLKLSAGKGFRYPTLREMYMFGTANPDLRPESMWNYEVAFSHSLACGLSYGVNVFYIDGKNMIVAVPREGASNLNMNTGKIDNAGVEAQAAWRISAAWSADVSYGYLHMKYPVLAAPEHKLYAGATFAKGRWMVSTGLQYVSGLYTSTSPETTENFVLWNLRASFRAAKWIEIWVRGENLLAQRYEIIAGYPMPKATAIGGVGINF